jgi:hypothetical protein
MRTLLPLRLLACGVLAACFVSALARAAQPADDALLGRWALTISNGGAGWLEVKKENGKLDGALLWIGGSVEPLASAAIADGTLTVKRKRPQGAKAAPKQPVIDTFTARLEGDTLKGQMSPGTGNAAGDRLEFTGKRTPPLPPRPNLASVKFGERIALFNGRDLTGWKPKETNLQNAWLVENGVLVNRPPAHGEGQPRVRTANLRTEREFEDFNLTLEVSVPAGSNSGVYLRGTYEVAVADSYGKPLDSHNMGAIYSRLTPTVAAEKAAGEWQTLDITLVDRHATVILNGKRIIDNQPLLGCTGGAMWSDQLRPGPIFLQGDHGAVSYRNIVLKPVVK